MNPDGKCSCRGFSDALAEIAEEGSGVIFPKRREGAAMQDVMLRAAGLALGGKRVFVSSEFDPIFIARCYEQIRTSIAIPNLKVALSSIHDGPALDREGAAMQMNEDFALMRLLPGMVVLSPSDSRSAYVLTHSLASLPEGPAYMRLSNAASGDIYGPEDSDFGIGSARLLSEGDGVTICATGVMVSEALAAKDALLSQGICADVIDCYSIKPFPERTLLASVRRTGCCVVAEKHAAAGGLFSAAAECICREYPVPVRSVSVEDRFGQSGTGEELREYYGLTHREIVHNVLQVWAIRRR
ncbi:MAG: transketolase [Synergistaceae bacterium]|jgi:transketolase|nr:transketolase [Synergistaceae bacterium]